MKRKIAFTEAADLRSLRLPWIEFHTESQRHYPKGHVASHVVGSVDHEEKGNSGLELGFDAELRGEAGSAEVLTDVHSKVIESEPMDAPKVGTNMVLSIDERIQFAAERDLKEAIDNSAASGGAIVVMNPKNGEILGDGQLSAVRSQQATTARRAPRSQVEPGRSSAL